jgi:adenylosuccinate lyase
MIPRYTSREMAALWSDAARFSTWFEVEMAVTAAWESHARVPAGTSSRLTERAHDIDWAGFAQRVDEIENVTRHDVIAFLTALEERLGEDTRHVHYGMTSSDVVDTAFALHLVRAGRIVVGRGLALVDALLRRALEHKMTLCLGRTHGQAAEPTTFGVKLLSLTAEIARGVERVARATDDVAFGKISGAVGNFGNIPPAVEARALTMLGLEPEPMATQVVPRDRHAAFFASLAVLAGSVERLAVEVRHLQRTEVSEAFEPFGQGQKGSSAMPHKKNPILTENLTGLCRLVRGYAGMAFENQALWHERDISHSSVERMVAPDSTTTMDFALSRAIRVVDGLVVDGDRMRAHLEGTGGLVYSEGVLLALIDTGLLRQEAYVLVQKAAMRARDLDENVTFQDALKSTLEIASRLGGDKIDEILDPHHHLRHVDVLFARTAQALSTSLARARDMASSAARGAKTQH